MDMIAAIVFFFVSVQLALFIWAVCRKVPNTSIMAETWKKDPSCTLQLNHKGLLRRISAILAKANWMQTLSVTYQKLFTFPLIPSLHFLPFYPTVWDISSVFKTHF